MGGDFYDVVALDDGWVAFVGDVTGKGAPAAAITARARYTMTSVAQLTGRAAAAIERLNLSLVELGGLSFCTLAVAVLPGAPGDGRVELISAGHPLPYAVRREGVARVGETGPLLGFDPVATWPTRVIELAPAESIVLYSDGVTDTVGGDGERFGERRLEALLVEGSGDSAAELLRRLDRGLVEFQGPDQRDDVAVLVLRREPSVTAPAGRSGPT